MADPESGDVEMKDVARASEPFPSPFALLNPKREPSATQHIKPKFEPKVKPRPGARARTQPPAQTQSKIEVERTSSASRESHLPILGDRAEASGLQITNSAIASEDVSLFQVKAEPNAVKEEAVRSSFLVNVKQERRDEDVGKLNSELDVSGELLASEKVKEELRTLKEEVVGVKDESLDGHAPSLGGGDRVVREIDVFLTPNVDSETQLYLLQYPLRPYWRPYNLEERCQEVRIKPQQSKFEVDLVIDTSSDNYDADREPHLQITKQTLVSSKVPMTTSYAIGILRGNQLYLNPVQAVVQFRPSMKYIDDNDAAKKKSNKDAGITDGEEEEMVDAEPAESKSELTLLQVNVRRRETERQEANRLQSHAYLKQLDEAEAWIPLEPHGTESPVTVDIRQKMVATTQDSIRFDMSPDVYLDTLVPGRASASTAEFLRGDGSGNAGISRRELESLSLDGALERIFQKGLVQVLQFERLVKMAPKGCNEAELLEVLGNHAVLVQGCWVACSKLRAQYPISAIRDYILLLFSRNRVVLHEQLQGLPLTKEALREILVPIAVQRGAVGWEFQEDTDKSFIKKHHSVVKTQTGQWNDSEAGIREILADLNADLDDGDSMEIVEEKKPPIKKSDKQMSIALVSQSTRSLSGKSQGIKAVAVIDAGEGSGKSSMENGESSGHMTMSEATRLALPSALKEIFAKHHVCSMQIIVQSLRDMAIERTVANSNPKAAAAAVAAAKAANAPLPELTAAVNKVATSLNGVYFLSSLGNPTLDPFRDVVIALLRKMGPNTGLRKNDIMLAFKATGRDVPAATYTKVMKELCYTRGGAWVLKPGDGRPT